MEIFQTFLLPSAWLALLTLAFLEIVLGIDNIVFLSIMTSKLPAKQQPKGRFIGLLLAMLARIGLLFCISLLMRLTQPLFSFQYSWIQGSITGQSLIILFGGIFLLYKSVTEIHHKLEASEDEKINANSRKNSFWSIIFQVVALDIIFSFDSVLTAVGMVSFKDFGYGGALTIMITAIIVAVTVMMFFSGPISNFVNNHPTIQMLALSFLILIGVTLLIDAAHLAHLNVLGTEVNEIPKGYIYFAIAFSLLVEMLNMRLSKKSKPVRLYDSQIKRKSSKKSNQDIN
ncbi:MAG: TerC family protein [Tannerella sp.]|jgi:predicted tellurium resistance membrane protein TerC|nr:TerC family protein [Tannerella sp.]